MPNRLVSRERLEFQDNSLLQNSLETGDIGVWSWCIDTNWLHVSDHFLSSLGVDTPPVNQLSDFLPLIAEHDREPLLEAASECVRSGCKFTCEIHLAAPHSDVQLWFVGQPLETEPSVMAKRDSSTEMKPAWLSGFMLNISELRKRSPLELNAAQMLESLLEQTPISTWIADRDGTMLRINPACEELFGITHDQAVAGLHQYNLFTDPEFVRSGSVEKIQEVFSSGKPTTIELDYNLGFLQHKAPEESDEIYIKASVLPVIDENGEVTRAAIQHQDLSREHRVEEDLQEHDQMLYSIINNTNSVISVKDFEGRYLLVNHEFSRLAGIDQNLARGLTDFDVFPEAVAKRIREYDLQTLKGNQLLELEETLPVRTEEGGAVESTFLSVRFPIRGHDGALYAIGMVLTDITSRKEFEATIESQRKELRLLLDSMRSSIWYLDRWGLIKDCNQLAQKSLPLAMMKGKSFMELPLDWDDLAERQREIMQVIRSGIPILNSVESTEIEGKTIWLNVDKIPTKDADGEVNGLLLVATDISETVSKETALRDSEARYKAFIANSSEAIWRYDVEPAIDINLSMEDQVRLMSEHAVLAECNDVLVKMFGAKSAKTILGLSLTQSGSKNYLLDLDKFIRHNYQLVDYEITREDRRGNQAFLQMSAIGTVENGKLIRVWGTTRDITDRKRYLAKLEYQATHDSLTLLPNRNLLYREMENAIHERKSDQKMVLLLIDLDRFKEINDTLGHHAGDKLLKQIGPRLEAEMEETPGMVARLGGDEFAIFLPRIRNNQHAVVFCHRVLDAIRQDFLLEGFHTEISASIGIAICPDQAHDVSTLMRYADVAMYRAKTEMLGVSIYSPECDPHSPKRLSLMSDLGRAIREDQLLLHFQPKINIATGRAYGVEALLRWNHPEMGFIPPGEFIPIAEMTDLIHPMTLWVLENSLRQCNQWSANDIHMSIAVNLSAQNLLDENIADQVEEMLLKYQFDPGRLELEITESAIMIDPSRAMRSLERIHALGVRLSIDDFGTGYSSLAYLKRLPVQTLKVDYSFVHNMLEDEQDSIIVNSTINLAHNLGLNVVAEGVETEAVLERLKEMGCDNAQGFYIAKPMPCEAADEWFKESGWL